MTAPKTRPCEICKQPIDPDRIEAVPETRLCTEHAMKAQKYGGEFIVKGEFERTSKTGSLKHNYGGISTTKTRNRESIERLLDEYYQEEAKNES